MGLPDDHPIKTHGSGFLSHPGRLSADMGADEYDDLVKTITAQHEQIKEVTKRLLLASRTRRVNETTI